MIGVSYSTLDSNTKLLVEDIPHRKDLCYTVSILEPMTNTYPLKKVFKGDRLLHDIDANKSLDDINVVSCCCL